MVDQSLYYFEQDVGKKVYKINRLKVNDDITIVMFDKIKFNHLKLLMTKGDINE